MTRLICTTCYRYACRCPQPEPAPAPACAETLDIFAKPAEAPRQRHSATSTTAAEKVEPTLSHKRRDVLAYICEEHPNGCTDNELIAGLVARGWSPNTPRARRVDLTPRWLHQVGERDGCAVWGPTDEAAAWFNGNREERAA